MQIQAQALRAKKENLVVFLVLEGFLMELLGTLPPFLRVLRIFLCAVGDWHSYMREMTTFNIHLFTRKSATKHCKTEKTKKKEHP